MRANRQCSMCGKVTEVFVNPANTRIARCQECMRHVATALDRGEPIIDPFVQDLPETADASNGADTQNPLENPKFVRMLERGYARTLIKKARRGFFGSVFYYAIIHGKRIESDDQEELVAWIVDQL